MEEFYTSESRLAYHPHMQVLMEVGGVGPNIAQVIIDMTLYDPLIHTVCFACKNGRLNLLKYLIPFEPVASKHIKIAAKHKHYHILQFLQKEIITNNECLSYCAEKIAFDGQLDILKEFLGTYTAYAASMYGAIRGHQLEIVKFICEQRVINIGLDMYTVLRCGNRSILEYFISQGVIIQRHDFVLASQYGNIEIVHHLFEILESVDLNEAYVEASKNRHKEVVDFLLRCGANPSYYNNLLQHWAVVNLQLEFRDFLRQLRTTDVYETNRICMRYAVSSNNEDILEELIDQGGDVNIDNSYLIKTAAKYDLHNIVVLLVNNRARIPQEAIKLAASSYIKKYLKRMCNPVT